VYVLINLLRFFSDNVRGHQDFLEALGDCLGLGSRLLFCLIGDECRSVVANDADGLLQDRVVVQVFSTVLGGQLPGHDLGVEVHAEKSRADWFDFGRLYKIFAIFLGFVLFVDRVDRLLVAGVEVLEEVLTGLGVVQAVVECVLLAGQLFQPWTDRRMSGKRHRLLAGSLFGRARSHIFLHARNALIRVTHVEDLAIIAAQVDVLLLDD